MSNPLSGGFAARFSFAFSYADQKICLLPLIIFPICAIILSTYVVNKGDWR